MNDITINPNKRILAQLMDRTFLNLVLLRLLKTVFSKGYIRAVHYHDTTYDSADNFEKQLQFYQHYFSPVSLKDLELFLKNKLWKKAKPGLIISFDDGLRSNYEIATPLLEKYGFIGWFFIPPGFVDTPLEAQNQFAREHDIVSDCRVSLEDRIAISWEEALELKKKHVLGCHTLTHHRMAPEDSDGTLDNEIIESKLMMEQRLNHPIDIFCWVGGEEQSYTRKAAQYIQKAGYRYSFMTNTAPILPHTSPFQLQRTNVEAFWPLDIIKFQLCGIMDLLYIPKRKRVNQLTN